MKEKEWKFEEFWTFKWLFRWLFLLVVIIFTYGFLFENVYWGYTTGENIIEKIGNICIYTGGAYALLKMGDFM